MQKCQNLHISHIITNEFRLEFRIINYDNQRECVSTVSTLNAKLNEHNNVNNKRN